MPGPDLRSPCPCAPSLGQALTRDRHAVCCAMREHGPPPGGVNNGGPTLLRKTLLSGVLSLAVAVTSMPTVAAPLAPTLPQIDNPAVTQVGRRGVRRTIVRRGPGFRSRTVVRRGPGFRNRTVIV